MKKAISMLLAVLMVFTCLTACQQTTTVTETTTSDVTQGDVTIEGGNTTTSSSKTSSSSTTSSTKKPSSSKTSSATKPSGGSNAVDNASTVKGTVGGTKTQGGWTSNNKNLTAEELDAPYPLRKNISGNVRVLTPFNDATFKKAVEDFKKNYPNTTVEVITTTNVSRNEKLLSLINAGQSPDYVYSTYQDYPLRAAKGLTMPIDKYIQEHPGQSDALMNNNCSYNGERYCVIIETPITVLYYNTALFERVGEKTPDQYLAEGNWTWATLRKVAKKLTDAQNGIYGFATDADYYFSLCMGEDVIKFENGVAKLNLKGNQEYMDAHQILVDMINVDKSTVPTHWIAHTEFAKGTVGMAFTSLSHHTFFDDANMKTYDYTLMAKPSADSDYYSTVGGVNGGFSIAKGAKNIEGGMAFGEQYLNTAIANGGNQTKWPKAYELVKKYNVKKIVPWFYGFGLEGLYAQDLCGWIRTGTKDINTLIEENAPLFEAKLKEYQ